MGKWGLRRLPWAERPLDAAGAGLPAGPLRVLYMVAAPLDQVSSLEREEELLLRVRPGRAAGSVRQRRSRQL